jgi:hypothetical protein
VTLSGVASVVDACGVCGGFEKKKKKKKKKIKSFPSTGNGTSCQCNGGYLNFSPGDANAGVLCYVDDELSKQVSFVASLLLCFVVRSSSH